MDRTELQTQLETFGQGHLLAFWDSLSGHQRVALASQLAQVDLAQIDSLMRTQGLGQDWREVARRAEPPPAIRLADQRDASLRRQAYNAGAEALDHGQVAVLMVAGGQGTRLGFPHPKGMFPIGPLSQRCLYQWHIDQLRALRRRYGQPLGLWLMTSPATDESTRELMARNQQFGLPPDDLHIFQQGTMPAVDARTGRLLLEQPHRLALSPDGHGGMLAALCRSGELERLRQSGVRLIYYFQVDNPLLTICDPLLLGYHLLHGSEMTTQVIAKQIPTEKVGNVVVVDGRMQVVEYSDLPDDLADRRTRDGRDVFWAGSIAVHVFDIRFLERAQQSDQTLPFHRAHKAVAHVDPNSGRQITPSEPNAVKFERFIFDLMPWAANPLVVEVDAADQFEPLKNASGAANCSPESVRQALVAKYCRWLAEAGCQVCGDVAVEIHPLFAMDAEELTGKLPRGTRIDAPRYFAEPA